MTDTVEKPPPMGTLHGALLTIVVVTLGALLTFLFWEAFLNEHGQNALSQEAPPVEAHFQIQEVMVSNHTVVATITPNQGEVRLFLEDLTAAMVELTHRHGACTFTTTTSFSFSEGRGLPGTLVTMACP